MTVHLRDERVTPEALPESVLQYVLRIEESVILEDAAAESAFAEDAYIRQSQARSILCMPLINQTKLAGVLYLENNLTRGVFAPARTAVLKLLASQAAMSLENATLYSDLRHSEAYLAEAQRLSQTGSFGWNVSSGRIVWSDETFRIFGHVKAASVTIEMGLQRVHPDDLARVQQTIVRASQDRKDFADECRLLMPDGSIKHVHVVARATNNEPGNIEFVGAVMDVTAAKQADQALRESEQRFRDYAETASDWYWETGPDHKFTRVTEYERLVAAGRDPASRMGFARWGYATDVESEPEKWVLHRSMLEAQQPFRDFVYQCARRDGSRMYVKTSGKPYYDAKGAFLGYRGTGADVTATVRADQAEAALREVQAELAHVARVSTLGELTASIAHEVNQPIAATVANAGAGLRWLGAEPPNIDEVRQALGRIMRDGSRAGAVVGRIRALIKKAPPRDERVEMNAAIREVIELTHSEAVKHRILVRTELAQGQPPIQGDRVELQQVILNLMLNAIEAMSGMSGGSRELLIGVGTTEFGRRCSSPCAIWARDWRQLLWRIFSRPSTRRSRTAWGSGCRSAARSSKRTAEGCGRVRMNRAAPFFSLPCLPNGTKPFPRNTPPKPQGCDVAGPGSEFKYVLGNRGRLCCDRLPFGKAWLLSSQVLGFPQPPWETRYGERAGAGVRGDA